MQHLQILSSLTSSFLPALCIEMRGDVGLSARYKKKNPHCTNRDIIDSVG